MNTTYTSLDRVEKVLATLVAFKTYQGNPEKSKEVNALYDYFTEGLPDCYTARRVCSGDATSLVIERKNAHGRQLILQSHIDVVPGAHEQFILKKEGGKLVGRGVSDMKFAAACYYVLLRDLAATDLNISVWLSDDEEIGGFNGVGALVEKVAIPTGSAVFLPDCDSLNAWKVVTKSKGLVHVSFQAAGVSAHGSKPWLGKNPIETLSAVARTLSGHALFAGSGKWRNTVVQTVFHSGDSVNRIPEVAETSFDIRTTTEVARGKIEKLIHTLAKKNKMTITRLFTAPSFDVPVTDPAVVAFVRVLKRFGTRVAYGFDNGSSDTRFFVQKGIPVVMCKPAAGGDHAAFEWIEQKDLLQYINILRSYIELFLSHTGR
jgi:succinyl-diaminopimelate desuccinylase